MIVAVTGSTGLIGSALVRRLAEQGHQVHAFTRRPEVRFARPEVRAFVWDPMQGQPPEEALAGVHGIVHLAGEPVAQRWNPEVKARIRDSRVVGTRYLVQALSTLSPRPAVLVSASAVGYYGDRGDETLTEDAPPGRGFLPKVCIEWEREATLAEALGMRVVLPRIGVVLASGGGALERMVPIFKFGLGGPIGSGKQWMPWIHLDDIVGLLIYALENPLSGPVNAAAPAPATNAAFTRALAMALHRPAFLPVPPFAVKAVFGEMSRIVLASQKVIPKAALDSGYTFRHPALDAAMASVFP
ncbi:MAG: TIGR01777 family protein [Bryobacterales bacterium]|nr:TIGR01777 family protein [Bryobacterales bacterium]